MWSDGSRFVTSTEHDANEGLIGRIREAQEKATSLIGRVDANWLAEWAVGEEWEVLVGDFDRDGRDDLLVVDAARGEWQVARNAGTHFVPAGELKPWAAGAYMQPLVGVFTDNGRASLCARQKWLRGGVVDFAVSVLGGA